MNPRFRSTHARHERGQTIIVAMIVLGLLLLLGFVFLGILNRNIKTAGFLGARGIANDLSEAGVRYAHQQLLQSPLGADWRGQPTPIIASNPANTTYDPDAFFLRPPAVTAGGVRLDFINGSGIKDLGGPDGLGPFFRVNFPNGRALVRVRYAPSDANILRNQPSGPLRNPGVARQYILIESVGRQGAVSVTDPTLLASQTPRIFRDFADEAQFRQALNQFRADQAQYGGIQFNRAFASIGLIETARFVTNKYRVSRPIEIGNIEELGATYRGANVGSNLPLVMGGTIPIPGQGVLPLGGSAHFNGDLRIHGDIALNMNATLGDGLTVAGTISGDANSQLQVTATRVVNGTYTPPGTATLQPNGAVGVDTYNSRSPYFTTLGGLVRDGVAEIDRNGYPRGVGLKVAPTMLGRNGENRYLTITRESGFAAGGGNSGRFGHGQGVYVDNLSDRFGGVTEESRRIRGANYSLVEEWLNPGAENTRWNGTFLYTPQAAYVMLLPDGFTIQRSGANDRERTWKLPNGADSGESFIRYRLGRGSDGRMRIVNSLTPGIANINANLATGDYDNGQPFNGVIYFEGDVRVRGTIPTDAQLTLVSNGSVYIEGSITKGVSGNQYTATYSAAEGSTAIGARLTRPSKSTLMLMAREYVALNTSQFFGPLPTESILPKGNVPNLPTFDPVRVAAAGGSGEDDLNIQWEFALDPFTQNQPGNPQTWRPYATEYVFPGSTTRVPVSLLVSHASDDAGSNPQTFFTLNLNADLNTPGPLESVYRFPFGPTNLVSTIPGGTNSVYGLGGESWQRYGQFESTAFTLVDPAATTVSVAGDTFRVSGGTGNYTLRSEGVNSARFQITSVGQYASNDYIVGRTAITPHDIRIEAAMFAEEGSFFVIPGAWFNPNPNDTYANYLSYGGDSEVRDDERLRRFGASPEFPFYGEPLDVRISIIGAVSENMPPTASQQAEMMRKWGWIPREIGATRDRIPQQHAQGAPDSAQWVPNLSIQYDPVLATGRTAGFVTDDNPLTLVRSAWQDYDQDGVEDPGERVSLPPMPRLPVSPTLAYFGEVR